MEKNNKGALILIIVLLVIFSSLSIWGFVGNLMGVNIPPEPENVSRQFKFNNKLYFYDMLNLIGTYECKTNECDYATGVIDDKDYSVNYYSKATEKPVTMISKRYAFISDGSSDVILYDIPNKSILNTFKAVKNYDIGIDNNYYILKDKNDKWGVMKFDPTAGLVIEYKYEFIGLHDEIKDGTTFINSDEFIVKDVNGWKVVSNTDVDKSSYFVNPIYDYNDKYVVTRNGAYYYLNSKISGNLLRTNLFSYTRFIGKYIAVVNSSNEYYLLNPDTLEEVSQKYSISTVEEVTLEQTTEGIKLSVGGELKEIIQ